MLLKAIAFVILLLVGSFILKTLFVLEVFKQDLLVHTPGPCRIIPGEGIGYEDMETLPNGLTFITSGLMVSSASTKLRAYFKKNNGRGRIYLFDFNSQEKQLEELSIVGNQFDPSDFAPHGISARTSAAGTVLLLVVNHKKTEDTIERFEYDSRKRQLKHLHTYRDTSIRFMNDVAMDTDTSFYFTNTAYYREPGIMHTLELLIPLAYGNVMYFDGNKYLKQDDNLQLPNGLIVTPDSQFVYMVQTIRNVFVVYRRENNGTLTQYKSVELKTGGDNPSIDADGNVLLGTLPIIWKIIKHLDDPEYTLPSQVIKLHMDNGNVKKITEVLSVGGDLLSGSSVASSYKNGLLVGTVHHKLLYCDVKWMD